MSVGAERGHFWTFWFSFCSVVTDFEDLLVVICFLLFTVERLKSFLGSSHIVRVSLLQPGGERIVSKEIVRMYVVGGAARSCRTLARKGGTCEE